MIVVGQHKRCGGTLGKPSCKKICFCLVFSEGGEVMSKQNFLRNFFLCLLLDIFQKEGGGLLNSKLAEALFCLSLKKIKEEGDGYPIPRLLGNFSVCVWTFF